MKNKQEQKRHFVHCMRGSRCAGNLLLVLFCFLLSGCWDNHELEDLAFVTVVGLDTAKGDNLTISYQYLTPPAESTGNKNTGDQNKPLITTFVTQTFGISPMIASTTTDRIISAQQVKAIIISEELGKKKNIIEYLDGLLRERAYRRDVLLVTSIGKAKVFMNNNRSKLGTKTLTFIENMRAQNLHTGLFPATTLNEFLLNQENGDGVAMIGLAAVANSGSDGEGKSVVEEGEALPGKIPKQSGDNRLQFSGAEVYRNGHAIGRLKGNEVRMVLLLRGDIRMYLQSLPDPEKSNTHDTIQLMQVIPPTVHAHMDHRRLHFVIDVPLYASLVSTTAGVDYVESSSKQKVLIRAYEKRLQGEALQLLKRSQTELKGDLFYFERAIKLRYLTEQDWKAFAYPQKFREARFSVRFHIHIKEFGKQRYPYGATD